MLPDNNNIDTLVDDLTMAREFSVLGDYSQSLDHFKAVMTKIQFQIKKSLNNQQLYFQWEQLANVIDSEMKDVKTIIQLNSQIENASSSALDQDMGEDDGRNFRQEKQIKP